MAQVEVRDPGIHPRCLVLVQDDVAAFPYVQLHGPRGSTEDGDVLVEEGVAAAILGASYRDGSSSQKAFEANRPRGSMQLAIAELLQPARSDTLPTHSRHTSETFPTHFRIEPLRLHPHI